MARNTPVAPLGSALIFYREKMLRQALLTNEAQFAAIIQDVPHYCALCMLVRNNREHHKLPRKAGQYPPLHRY